MAIYFGSDASIRTHVMKTVSTCFAALRQLRSARSCIPRLALQSLVVSLVQQRLDYANATQLAGLPAYLIDCVQSVLNATARLISSARCDDVMPLLKELHWLMIRQCIRYKLAVLAYRCLNCLAPS